MLRRAEVALAEALVKLVALGLKVVMEVMIMVLQMVLADLIRFLEVMAQAELQVAGVASHLAEKVVI